MYEQYPATDEEALQARTLDRRLSALHLAFCYTRKQGLTVGVDDISGTGIPEVPGLTVYQLPKPGGEYRIGADPAEGNPTSDASSMHVVDLHTGEEVAKLAGQIEIATFAAYVDRVGMFYNRAPALVERNNHGHAVLLWLGEYSRLPLLSGDKDANLKDREARRPKPGWLDNSRGKTMLYDTMADIAREGQCVIHSYSTYVQLQSIEAATLRAPEGEPDDEADSYSLAQKARELKPRDGGWAGIDI